jgi:2-aminoadipate transaminase
LLKEIQHEPHRPAAARALAPGRACRRHEPSAIREILKITERPGILNFAGGLPAPETFPVAAMREACAAVLAEGSPVAKPSLQYASSEGLPELRQWVAAELGKQGARVSPEQV